MTNGAAVSPVPPWVNQIPWVPIVTIVGWIAFAASFYFTTRATLDDHQRQIAAILVSRDKLLTENQEIQRSMNNGIAQLNQIVSVRNAQNEFQSKQLEEAIKRSDVRQDKVVQALDALFSTQQELLRALDALRIQIDKK
jgi:hypothetical protein